MVIQTRFDNLFDLIVTGLVKIKFRFFYLLDGAAFKALKFNTSCYFIWLLVLFQYNTKGSISNFSTLNSFDVRQGKWQIIIVTKSYHISNLALHNVPNHIWSIIWILYQVETSLLIHYSIHILETTKVSVMTQKINK